LDSYLQVAYQVLKAARRPMTARGILDAAYKASIVPEHLFGKTQQKTLQARLSEDILHFRETSAFYRTEPGHYFLSEMIADPQIPDEYKEKFPARRRTRDLARNMMLSVKREFVDENRDLLRDGYTSFMREADRAKAVKYSNTSERSEQLLNVWTFCVVRKEHSVLAYRVGRYRDDRDAFANKRSIGFPGPISDEDRSLFSLDEFGAIDCATNILISDLDLSLAAFPEHKISNPRSTHLFEISDEKHSMVLVAVMEWDCPEWFEPTTRRLSLNEPHWIEATLCRNHSEDFEPWSAELLSLIARTERVSL
jgi:hypothetical protein